MPSEDEKTSFAELFSAGASPAFDRRSFRVGEKLDVVVLKIGNVAVFVSLDGQQEGFIDRADLATKSGELAVKIGAKIYAKVAEIQGRNGAVRLVPLVIRGEDDAPPQGIIAAGEGSSEPTYTTGMVVKGVVSRIERYGVFVQITGSKKRGLLPAQESGTPRGADLHKQFPVGKEIETKIIGIDETGKIRLSVSALARDEEQKDFDAFAQGQSQGPSAGGAGGGQKAAAPVKQAPVTFGTFGDLLAKAQAKGAKKK